MDFIDSYRGVLRKIDLLTLAGIYIYQCILIWRQHPDKFKHSLICHEYFTRRAHDFNYPAHNLSLTKKDHIIRANIFITAYLKR